MGAELGVALPKVGQTVVEVDGRAVLLGHMLQVLVGRHPLVVHIVLGVAVTDVDGHDVRQLILTVRPAPAFDRLFQPAFHQQAFNPGGSDWDLLFVYFLIAGVHSRELGRLVLS